ncbi:unnamed protein product [Closterium sp. Yama58-4]|nr:unnamed protein product [Closterium sp. Yama58-4]
MAVNVTLSEPERAALANKMDYLKRLHNADDEDDSNEDDSDEGSGESRIIRRDPIKSSDSSSGEGSDDGTNSSDDGGPIDGTCGDTSGNGTSGDAPVGSAEPGPSPAASTTRIGESGGFTFSRDYFNALSAARDASSSITSRRSSLGSSLAAKREKQVESRFLEIEMQSRSSVESSQAAGAHDWRAALKARGRTFQSATQDWGAKQEQHQQVESREGALDAGRFTSGNGPSETGTGSRFSVVSKGMFNDKPSSFDGNGSAIDAAYNAAASQSEREACEPRADSSAGSAMEEVRRVERKMEAMEAIEAKQGIPAKQRKLGLDCASESERAVDADRSLDSNAVERKREAMDRTIESPELLNKAAMERAIEAMERIGASGGGDGGGGGDEGAGERAGEGESGYAEGGRPRGRGKDVAELEKEVEEAKQASHRIAVMFYQQDQELKDLRENHLALQEDHKRISVQLQAAQAETDELWNQLAAASRQKEAAEATAAELRLKIRMLAGNVEELEGEAEAAGGWGGGGGGGSGGGGGGGGAVGGTTAVEGASSLESDLVGLRKLKELEWELISARSARDRAMTVLAGMREEWNNLRKLRLQLDALTASREVAGSPASANGGRGAHAADRTARGKFSWEDVRGRAYGGNRRGEEDTGEAGGEELLKGVEAEIAEEADKWRKVVGQLQEDHVRVVVEAQDAAEKCAGARRQAEAATEEAMRLRRDIERVREEKTIAEEDLRDFRKGWKDLAGHLETFAAKVSEMDAELAVKRKEREVMAIEIERSAKERDLMAVEIGRVRKERDFMTAEIERLLSERSRSDGAGDRTAEQRA